MLLQAVVHSSLAVSRTRSSIEKIDGLAELLKRLAPDEISIGVAYLSGALPQGRIGIGWAAVTQARTVAHAAQPSLGLREINDWFGRMAGTRGPTREHSS